MDEFELIARLSRLLPLNDSVVVGIGDDCAVLDVGRSDRWLLLKIEAVVEGVHFGADAPPEKIGHKAIAKCLSDVAAMGGNPDHAVVTLAVPREFDVDFVEAVYRGLGSTAARYGVAVVGGETTLNQDRLLLSVSMTGSVAKDRCVLRSGAKAGDAIFVTGELGGSLAGKHLDFEPRLAEARWLVDRFPIHAMIDLSDGLAGDLPHVLKASHVGAEILADAIPTSRAAKLAFRSRRSGKPPLIAALTDGEDFELLFTVPGKSAVPLLDAWKERFPDLKLSCIGKIITQDGLLIRDKKGVRPVAAHGYNHFKKP